ncbi:hypothetical protein Taro_027098, partial [Colocasia esculenta]|nr:hypothetical protein [Colocasia esculenta]
LFDFLDASYRSAASQCRGATGCRDSPCISMHMGILSHRSSPSRLHVVALRYVATTAAHEGLRNQLLFILPWVYPYLQAISEPLGQGTQVRSHKELLFSSRLEDEKKVPSIISLIEENTTWRYAFTRPENLPRARVIWESTT